MTTFKSLAHCNDRTARDYLDGHDWDVNQALNAFYDNEPDQELSYSPELSELFMKYAVTTPHGSIMDTDGLIKYIRDLGYEIEDLATLCLAQLLNCQRLTDGITEEQFSYNWQQNRCITLPEMGRLIQRLDHKLHTNEDYMSQLYNYTFELALDPGAKTLETPTAVQYWTLFFASEKYPIAVTQPLFQHWISFVEQEQAISRDVWRMLFPFFKRFPNLELIRENYNEADAWPYIIDEFYEYLADNGEI